MIYNYILSTGDTSISGSLSSGYANQKDFSSNFLEDFYYDSTLVSGEQKMKLASNGQVLFEEIPTETAGTNETIYQVFSGDIFLKTGASDEFDRNRIFGSSNTPFKGKYNVTYEKYTGKSAIGLGTGVDTLGEALSSGISGISQTLFFDGYEYFLNGQKVYSGFGVGVEAGVGTQFTLGFTSTQGGVETSANKSNFKAFTFIKEDRLNEITGVEPDIHGSGFIEGQTNFYLNGVKENDSIYLELYTGVNIIEQGTSAGLFDLGIQTGAAYLSL